MREITIESLTGGEKKQERFIKLLRIGATFGFR